MPRPVKLSIVTDGEPVDMDTFTHDVAESEAGLYVHYFELFGQTGIDRKTGRPQGNREYPHIKIHKRLDGASTGLFQLFATNTPFTATFEINLADFTDSGDPGQVAAVITIGKGTPRNAYVSSYALRVPDAEAAVHDNPREPYEEVTFSFDVIEFKKSGTDQKGQAQTKVVQDSHSGKHK